MPRRGLPTSRDRDEKCSNKSEQSKINVRAHDGSSAAEVALCSPHVGNAGSARGESMRWVAEQLGHSEAATSSRFYAKWINEEGRRPPATIGPAEVYADLFAELGKFHHSPATDVSGEMEDIENLVSLKKLTGAPGGIRGRASLALRFASEAGSRRRIPTQGRSMTHALVIGISRRRAAYRGTQDGAQHRKRHPGALNFRWVGWPSEPVRRPPASERARFGYSDSGGSVFRQFSVLLLV